MTNHTLQLERLSWQAGGRAIVDEVSLSATSGELIAVMGRNGAGKSSLLDLIAGLRTPGAGRVSFDGKTITSMSAGGRAKCIGHLPQITRDLLPFSVVELVAMGRYPHADRWFESAADRRAIEAALVRCQCDHLRNRHVSTLSGGERQRVLLAACLAQEPEVLLLDEPSTFLDIDQQLHIFTILREEAARGRICLAVTHDINLALTFCSRLVVLLAGGVAIDCPTADAQRDDGWLSLFSSRLTMHADADGHRWVSYR